MIIPRRISLHLKPSLLRISEGLKASWIPSVGEDFAACRFHVGFLGLLDFLSFRAGSGLRASFYSGPYFPEGPYTLLLWN